MKQRAKRQAAMTCAHCGESFRQCLSTAKCRAGLEDRMRFIPELEDIIIQHCVSSGFVGFAEAKELVRQYENKERPVGPNAIIVFTFCRSVQQDVRENRR